MNERPIAERPNFDQLRSPSSSPTRDESDGDSTATKPASARSGRDHFLYIGMSVACAVTVFIGFSRTFYLGSAFGAESLTPLLMLHGVVFSGWMVLFFIQTVLVSIRRTRLHRQLGFVGVGLAVAMVVLGLAISIASVQDSLPVRGERALAGLAHLFGDVFVFAALVATAIGLRRQPEVHKRLMLLATVSILNPAIARWPLDILPRGPLGVYPVQDLFIVAAIAYEFAVRRRVHPAYLYGGLFIVAAQAARFAVRGTDIWLSFASFIVGP